MVSRDIAFYEEHNGKRKIKMNKTITKSTQPQKIKNKNVKKRK